MYIRCLLAAAFVCVNLERNWETSASGELAKPNFLLRSSQVADKVARSGRNPQNLTMLAMSRTSFGSDLSKTVAHLFVHMSRSESTSIPL